MTSEVLSTTDFLMIFGLLVLVAVELGLALVFILVGFTLGRKTFLAPREPEKKPEVFKPGPNPPMDLENDPYMQASMYPAGIAQTLVKERNRA